MAAKKPSIDQLIANYNKPAVTIPQQYQQGGSAVDMGDISNIGSGLSELASSLARGLADPALQLAQGTQNLVSRGLSGLTGIPAQKFGLYNDSLLDGAASPELAELASIPGSLALPGGAILKGAKGLNALAKGAGLGGAYGAAMGASRNPNSNVEFDALLGAALPAGIMGVTKGIEAIPSGINSLKRKTASGLINKLEADSANPYSQVLSPELAAKKLEMLGDVPVDLGTLVNDPGLADKYRKSANTFGSKTFDRAREAVGKTQMVADKMAEHLWQGHDEPSATAAIKGHLQNNFEFQKRYADKLYNQLDETAANRNVDTSERPNLKSVTDEFLTNYSEVQKKGGEHWLNDPTMYKLIKNINEGGTPVSFNYASGKANPLRQDYEDIKQLRSFLGSQLGELTSKPIAQRDYSTINKVSKLRQAAEDDIAHALKDEHSELYDLHKMASDHYRDNVVPYLRSPNIDQILRNPDPQNVFNRLNVASDPEEQKYLSKAIEHMDPTYQKLLLGLGLKNAVKDDVLSGEIKGNATALVKGYDKLKNSPVLKQVLDDSDHEMFKKLGVMNESVKDYRPILKNPETGAKNTPLLMKLAQIAPGVGTAAGAALSGVGAIPAVLAGTGLVAGTTAYKNAISNLLANPKVLQAYAKPSDRTALLNELSRKSPQSTVNMPKTTAQRMLEKGGKVAKTVTQKTANTLSNPMLINYLLNMRQ